MTFVDQQWRAHVVDSARGRLDRRGYELCVAYELRSALRSGRVWVSGSRRHNDPASYPPPADRWRDLRERFAATVSRPLEVAERLPELADEQAQLARLSEVRDLESEARLVDGELITEDDTTGETGVLAQHIEQRLPEVDLSDLLIEVDGWTGFTGQLTPLSGNRSRSPDMPNVLFAAITAQATNLGLTGMARASEFSYDQLDWATEHYLREETLTDASACLVDYHHGLSLTSAWGAGRLSSSDGQRFASRTREPAAAALPRYFGDRRRGLQIYSWISDQYSEYASKVAAATVRDATHTLDGILDNQTVLPIEEHSTDTHGYSDIIFGLFRLLGYRYARGWRTPAAPDSGASPEPTTGRLTRLPADPNAVRRPAPRRRQPAAAPHHPQPTDPGAAQPHPPPRLARQSAPTGRSDREDSPPPRLLQ